MWIAAALFALRLGALDDIVSRYSEYGFGGVVLVEQRGTVILRKGYGPAYRKNATPNKPETRFAIASITKSFTATAIMQLAAAGKISLDDPIGKYLDAGG